MTCRCCGLAGCICGPRHWAPMRLSHGWHGPMHGRGPRHSPRPCHLRPTQNPTQSHVAAGATPMPQTSRRSAPPPQGGRPSCGSIPSSTGATTMCGASCRCAPPPAPAVWPMAWHGMHGTVCHGMAHGMANSARGHAAHQPAMHAMPLHAMPRINQSCHALRHAMPCHAAARHAMPCHAMPHMPDHGCAPPCSSPRCRTARCTTKATPRLGQVSPLAASRA